MLSGRACLQNPTTHYANPSDWGIISGNPNTWIDKGTTKSIYDPCPYGYRVPINGTWAAFTKQYWDNGDIKGGGVWRSTWWPATGYRLYNSATMGCVAWGAYHWSSSPYGSTNAYSLYFNYIGDVYISANNHPRSHGFSLRCVQE